jgi:LmbE family N-acetylglucosaminyl deacetylase
MGCNFVDLRSITGGRNLLVLAAAPGDESLYCGHLIAQAAAGGRPPFVAVLTDGNRIPVPKLDSATPDEIALRHARDSARATTVLGVPDQWFLVLGPYDGTVSTSGPRFESVVDALSMIMWRRDCNLIAVPWAADQRPDYIAAHAVGMALSTRDGVAHMAYRTIEGSDNRKPLCLTSDKSSARRLKAIAIHSHLRTDFQEGYYPIT